MRGEDDNTGKMFSYVSAERRIAADHPLRGMRQMVDAVLKEMSARFDGLYAKIGRPSIAPEKLLAGTAAADSLQRAQRAAADGTARLQPAVPLVRRPGDG
jgi:hypothetical protein